MPKRLGISGVFTVAVLGLGAAALAGTVSAAERGKWIVDESSGCGTSNPFPSPEESIKWFGECRDGRLHGSGTLIWYRGNAETERNDGTFKDGELQGEAITTYPGGHVIVGQYNSGRRDGRFVTIKPNGAHVEASYRNGKLTSQRTLGPREVAAWKRERATRLAASMPEATPSLAKTAPRRAAPRPATPRPQPAARPQSLAWAGAAPPRSAPRAARSAQWAQPSPVPAPRPAPRPLTRTANRGGASNGSATAIPAGPVVAPRGTNVVPRRTTARFAAKPVRSRPSATELARYYAGTGGDYAGRGGVATGNRGALARPPAAAIAPLLRPPNGTRKPLVVAAPRDAAEADKMFTSAYQSERAGRFFEAEQSYERILMQFPSAKSAVLANTRLDALRNRNGADGAPGGTFHADRGTRGGGARVVAVNAPNPVRQEGGRRPRADGASLYKESADIGRRVCTVDGLYEDGARWCGVVVRDESSHFRVEVRRVELPGFGTLGIGRSTCTGNTFINWFSRGASVRVPKQCLAFHG